MQHKVKVTVIDKKVYPDLQQQFCADPAVGACPCYQVGDEYLFERYGKADDFWHMGTGTLVKAAGHAESRAGSPGIPHCSEAWDAISRYIYTGLQGGSIMRGWMNDERVMIACCSDGTRPVIFKIERLDYKAVSVRGITCDGCRETIRRALMCIDGVTDVAFRREAGADELVEVYTGAAVSDESVQAALGKLGAYSISGIA